MVDDPQRHLDELESDAALSPAQNSAEEQGSHEQSSEAVQRENVADVSVFPQHWYPYSFTVQVQDQLFTPNFGRKITRRINATRHLTRRRSGRESASDSQQPKPRLWGLVATSRIA